VEEGSALGAAECWPGILYANASNPPPLRPGFSVGDVVAVAFTKPTNAPPTPLVFEPPLGSLAFTWLASGTGVVARVVDAAVGGQPIRPFDVDVGKVRVVVVGVTARAGATAAVPSLPLLVGGTWGVPAPPSLVLVEAWDSGQGEGLGPGDTLVLTFDQEVWVWV
jgi:hypothetical protein